MRTYTQQHAYYCGVDLHARSLFVNVLDHTGRTCFEQDLPASPQAFLDAIQPYRDGLVVGVECMFAWYWLADLCERESIPFVLGHALAMKAIHGGRTCVRTGSQPDPGLSFLFKSVGHESGSADC